MRFVEIESLGVPTSACRSVAHFRLSEDKFPTLLDVTQPTFTGTRYRLTAVFKIKIKLLKFL